MKQPVKAPLMNGLIVRREWFGHWIYPVLFCFSLLVSIWPCVYTYIGLRMEMLKVIYVIAIITLPNVLPWGLVLCQ